jgi:phosphoglycerate dehydrogenase-like enzyme
VKVVIHQAINQAWKDELAALRQDFPESRFVAGLPEAEEHLPEADVVVSTNPTEDLIERASAVKLIIVPITGVDHLPLDLLTRRGIRLANAHGNARYVAERTVALILAYYGRIVEFHNDLTGKERWHGFWVRQGIADSWRTIHGRTVSIIGAGEIGGHIARFLKAFDTRLVGYRRTKMPEPPEHFDSMLYDLDKAIGAGDIVVIALPSTPETAGLFDARRLGRMEGKLLVNIGRGDIIDEGALYEGLKVGRPEGAALDAWWSYPTDGETNGAPSRYPIHELPNVVASPHLAGYVPEAVSASVRQTGENLRRFLSGEPLLTEVDPARGY